MKFGSVCSGIEAASVAFEPLGWKAAWFSEIEPFPCAVLKHHYPEVPNLGDMTTLPGRIKSGEVEAPDFFCGGTPCQAFSVAGLRQSLSDDRGNLSLTFCEIANAIDDVRLARGEPASIIFWENVPGVLSTQDNAFGCFLGALSGCDTPILPGRLGWTDAGVVAGRQRTVAWRVLDAQYFGLAQRRKRVFVVASAREGFNPAEVLLEFQGLRRDFAPSREAGQRPSGALTARFGRNGGASNDDLDARRLIAFGGNNQSGPIDVATARSACASASGRLDFETETFLVQTAHTLRGEGYRAGEDGTGRGTPLVPVNIYGGNKRADRPEGGFYVRMDEDTSKTLDAVSGLNPTCAQGGTAVMQPIAVPELTATLLASAAGFSRTGGTVTEHETYIPMAFHPTQDPISSTEVCHSLGANENAMAAVMQPMAFPWQSALDPIGKPDNISGTLIKNQTMAVALPISIQGGTAMMQPIPFGIGESPDVGHCLRSGASKADKHESTTYVAQAIPIDTMNHLGRGDGHSFGDFQPGAPSYTLTKGHSHAVAAEVIAPTLTASNNPSRSPQSTEITAQVAAVVQATAAVAFTGGVDYENNGHTADEPTGPLLKGSPTGGGRPLPAISLPTMQVRRLTPVECERLQGFPDGYTNIPWRGKPESPDGPRYKALGNSWAVPCVQWIGRRIQQEVQGKTPS